MLGTTVPLIDHVYGVYVDIVVMGPIEVVV